MGKPDLISRRADYDRGDMDNADVVLLKDEWMVRGAVVTERDGVVEKVKEAQKRVKEGDRPKGLVEVDGVWRTRKNNCIFVPDEVKAEVLQAYHDSPLAGHLGSTKTVGLVQREYWWPTIFGDVRSYVRGCDRCQRTKALRQTRARVLHPNEVPEGPWQIVTVDLIGELPESNGYNAICVLVDRFSKQMHAVPTTTKLTAEGMAKIYRDHVFRLHGLPCKIIHD